MNTSYAISATILQAAGQMHDAADKLQALLPMIGAVQSHVLLQALGQARRGADDLQQFAADMDEDAAGPVFEFDGSRGSLAVYLQANADDDDLCEWLPRAAVGDTYAGCTRVA